MTDYCGGGPSARNPNAPQIVTMGVDGIKQIFDHFIPFGSSVAWAINNFETDLDVYCASDPPPMPTWSATDMLAFAAGPAVSTWAGTRDKINALIRHQLWYQYCQCTEPGVLPPPPQPPPLPDKYGYASGPGPQGCYQAGWAGVPPTGNAPLDTSVALDLGPRLLPNITGPPVQMQDGNQTYNVYPVKGNYPSLNWVIKRPAVANVGTYGTPIFELRSWMAVGNVHSIRSWYDGKVPQDTAGTYQIAQGDGGFSFYAYVDTRGVGIPPFDDPVATLNLDWHCGSSSQPVTDCCPPDPGLTLALNNVYQVVLDIQNRLGTAGSYIDGVRHASLSGTGSLVLGAKTVAVRVETHPGFPYEVAVPGTPVYYYDMGFVTPYILTSPLRGTRITFAPQTVTLPDQTDQLGFTLRPGVQVDIIELVRG